jgi:hypothetical protein
MPQRAIVGLPVAEHYRRLQPGIALDRGGYVPTQPEGHPST